MDFFDEPIPVRTITTIDLTDYLLRYNKDQNNETLAPNPDPTRITHINKEKWVIVLDAEVPQIKPSNLTDSHFDSKIHKRITYILIPIYG